MSFKSRSSIKVQAVILSVSRILVTAMRFVLPMLLVRSLADETFGVYRLAWLLVLSTELIATIGIPRSLLISVPREKGEARSRLVYQSLYLLILFGILGGGAVYLSICFVGPLQPLKSYGALVGCFVGMWLASRMLEFLPTAEGRIKIQGAFICGLEFIRVTAVAVVAIVSPQLYMILFVLTVFSGLRLLIQILYVIRSYSFPSSFPTWAEVRSQILFAAPMGGTFFLNNFRKVGEQWVVAWLFSPAQYALYSVGALQIPIIALLRKSLAQVITPRLSRLQAAGEDVKALDLVKKANLYSAVIVFPVTIFFWVFAEQIVSVLFTESYLEAVPVLRVYILFFFKQALDMTAFMMVYNLQVFMLRVNVILLLATFVISFVGSKIFGLAGAALGSTVCIFIQTVVIHLKIMQVFDISVRDTQQWGALFYILGFSFISVLLSFFVVTNVDMNLYAQLIGGAFLFGAAYMLLLYTSKYSWVIKDVLSRKKKAESV